MKGVASLEDVAIDAEKVGEQVVDDDGAQEDNSP